MSWIRRTAAVALVGLAGCEPVSQPELPAVQPREARPVQSAQAPAIQLGPGGRVVESVTGSGHITVADEWRTFSFAANKAADGTVAGEFQAFNRAFVAKVHGRITCFTIVANEAWIGGVLERSDNPGLVGLAARWRVVDNGEGARAPADQISQIPLGAPGGAEQAYCADTPAFLPLIDVEAGNIQIRP